MAHDLYEQSFCLLPSSGSPLRKSCWCSKPDVLGAHLFGAGLPSDRAQCGAWTLYSSERTFAISIFILFLGRLPGGVSLYYTTSLPLLLMLCCLHFIFSCGKIFSVGLQGGSQAALVVKKETWV